ncbi:tubulin-tyrosine ligase [Pholiota conissans]|uniref:Tubulin-tyrosine ligase n=1 Tax=Pholiota conissans TaxID=109636 RepID=A0A9P5Z4U9_9AGAR|nr:tubulin-tyrosine ligase [Pholiota conissans]
MVNAFVSWPSAPLTDSLVRRALSRIDIPVSYIAKDQRSSSDAPLLQWCTYDEMDHELAHFKRDTVLSSSYTFRKALIRKHYLSRVIQTYLKKQPQSILEYACPLTFEIEISFADELDEMWTDELWELGEKLDAGSSWWILKPGMADRGMGIRMFNTKEDLQNIFESFEDDSEDEAEEAVEEEDGTAVVTSQLRHFVIQEYIMTPLLLDPSETMEKTHTSTNLTGRKFHLRVYCISKGDIQLFVYNRILALFSSAPYSLPDETEDCSEIDLKPHLTNTSLQTELGDSNVRLLDELEGCTILSGSDPRKLKKSDILLLISQIKDILAETFKAGLQNPVHFQALPNAFELFGVDFVVSHSASTKTNPFLVKILEINAEPAIELTGPRLKWILEDLFVSGAKICVEPFFGDKIHSTEPWNIGEVRNNLIKCMDEEVRGPQPTAI